MNKKKSKNWSTRLNPLSVRFKMGWQTVGRRVESVSFDYKRYAIRWHRNTVLASRAPLQRMPSLCVCVCVLGILLGGNWKVNNKQKKEKNFFLCFFFLALFWHTDVFGVGAPHRMRPRKWFFPFHFIAIQTNSTKLTECTSIEMWNLPCSTDNNKLSTHSTPKCTAICNGIIIHIDTHRK